MPFFRASAKGVVVRGSLLALGVRECARQQRESQPSVYVDVSCGVDNCCVKHLWLSRGVEQMVVVEYLAGPGFNYNEPARIQEGQLQARSGRFILKAYDDRGIRVARIPEDPWVYSPEPSADILTNPCVYVAWNADLSIKPLSEDAVSERSEENGIT
jgi:hypothetical protein